MVCRALLTICAGVLTTAVNDSSRYFTVPGEGPSLGTVKLHIGLLTALDLHIPPSVDDVVAVVHCVVIQTPGLAVCGDTAQRSHTYPLEFL